MSALVVIGVVAFFLYITSVFVWPRQRCRKCQKFSGRDHAPFPPGSLTYRRCRRCRGVGWHIRPMRRLLGGIDRTEGWRSP